MNRLRVLLLCRYGPMAASTRHRCLQYLPYLSESGFDVQINTLLDDQYLRSLYAGRRVPVLRIARSYGQRLRRLRAVGGFDLIWIHIEAFPWAPYLIESFFLPSGVPYVLDYDDAMFHRYDRHSSPVVRQLLGRKLDRLMRGAALVVAGNDYVADRARQAGAQRVEIIPTVVDLNRYPTVSASSNDAFTVGWIGSPATAYNLQLVRSALEEFSQIRPIRVIAVGSGNLQFGNVPLEVKPWSDATEVEDIQQFDVGIMPLVDSPFERGKSGFKLIQYMACSRPIIASPVGVNREIVSNGVNGFLAPNTGVWVQSLENLARDPALRRRLGEAGRLLVEERYSLQASAPRLAALLRSATEVPRVAQPLGTRSRDSQGPRHNGNIDPKTVAGFGDEWSTFDQSLLAATELETLFGQYFGIFSWDTLPADAVGFDLGCGSGRWARLVAPRVHHLHCVDPSPAALQVAAQNLAAERNCTFHLAAVDAIPLLDNSMDFGYSLGVLHHVPDTAAGIRSCVAKLKPGAPFLLYIYYAFDNRPLWFRLLWRASDILRRAISALPYRAQNTFSLGMATVVYWPLARASNLLERLGLNVDSLPLSYYRNRSFYVMRTDARDRFGTSLEQRFTARQIQGMMQAAGLERITFSPHPPYWCAVGFKRDAGHRVMGDG